MVRTLATLRGVDISDLASLFAEVRRLQSERNSFVHGYWERMNPLRLTQVVAHLISDLIDWAGKLPPWPEGLKKSVL